MSELWFYGQNGTQRGPVEFAALRALADAGTLRRTDLVWREGMADWVPAQTIDTLFPAAAPSVEPIVKPAVAPIVNPPIDAPTAPPAQPHVPPPTYQQPLGYGTAMDGSNNQNGRAVASLVLGICSLPTCICPFVGVALGVTAIVLGAGVRPGPNKGIAVGGLVCGIVGTVLGLPQTGNLIFHW